MAGGISRPTLGTQLPTYRKPSLPAPAGYQENPLSGAYESVIGSPSDQLAQRNRSQGFEDASRSLDMSMARQSLDQMRAGSTGANEKVNPYRDATFAMETGAYNDARNMQPAMNSSLSALLAGAGGGAVTAPNVPQVQYGGPALDAARSAAFARAKDNAAHTAQASLTGLSDELSRRGMGGGGYEAGQVGQTLSREANTIGEADREQAINDSTAFQHAADENYQGGITQRGQDMSAAEQAKNRALQASMEAFRATQQQSTQKAQMLRDAMAGLSGLSRY